MKTFIISACHPLLKPEDAELIIAGKAIVRGGYRDGPLIPHRLTPETRLLFEAAKEKGFLQLPRKITPLMNVWSCWCEGYQRPPIVIRAKGKWHQVKVDMIGLAHWERIEPTIQEPLQDLCSKYAARGKMYHIGCWTELLVDPSEAETVAREMLEIIQKAWA